MARSSAWIILFCFVLTASSIGWRQVRVPLILTGAMVLLAVVQLVPLPPAWWMALPGRDVLEGAALVVREEQPWRPLSISPSATSNALGSLIVPVVLILLAANLNVRQHRQLVTLLLALTVAGALLGLLQFSGARFNHPLVNDINGMVSANFANRNHFALLLSIGCVVALTWAFEGEDIRQKIVIAPGIVLLFCLLILATGSRTGVLLGIIGVALGLAIVGRRALREFSHLSRKVSITLFLLVMGGIVGIVWLTIFLDRAASVDRMLSLNAADDLRAGATPIVIDMVGRYFPAGAGFGTFDPSFRISEPDVFLRPSYFNHAHNDWLEIVIEGGAAAALLFGAALVWFLRRSAAVWFKRVGRKPRLAQLGSAIIFLILIASIVDYPARTPLIMAMLALAAVWLAGADEIRVEETRGASGR